MKKYYRQIMILIMCSLLICGCSKTNEHAENIKNKDSKELEQDTDPENVYEAGDEGEPQTVFASSKVKNNYIADLTYHLFSYMDLGSENAANVYSKDYIAKIEKIKKGYDFKDTLEEDLKDLTEVFYKRFSSLEKIMFIPFYVSSYEEFKNVVLTGGEFTEEDITDFVQPFLEVMEKEQEFYLPYWDNLWESDKQNRSQFIEYLNTQFSPIQNLLDYEGIIPEIYLCYSMSKNGRGFDKNGTKCVAVLSPTNEEKYSYSYFFVLHELTHVITDPIVGVAVSPVGEDHNIIENLVFLFDYYLLENLAPEQLPEYLDYIKIDDQQITNDKLEEIYEIKDEYKQKLHEIVDTIVSGAHKK